MKKRIRRIAIVGVVMMLGLVAFMGVGTVADNPQAVSVSARIAPTIQVTCGNTDVDWGSTDVDDPGLAPGATYTEDVGFTINSNKQWYMTVIANQDLTWGAYAIDNADLTYGVAGGAGINDPQAAGTVFSTAAATNVCGTPTRCARGTGLSATVTYSLQVDWDEEANTAATQYTATHTYTATQI